ncbi:hypothetical protein C1646_756065 [Rhizophagus diaphanus]|nr:hypothetical protein C1646_756065 [Rhizophagus diaphanus] [Rhizophagus sp. MUCL 43196]
MSQLPLVASAISSIIKCPVKTYDECKADGLKIDLSQILDLDTIYKKSLTRIEKHNVPPKEVTTSDSNKLIQIFVKPLDGDSKSIFVDPSITVLEFKDIICAKFGSDIKMMRLIFNGKQLDDFKTLTSYNIQKGSTVQVLSKVVGGYDFYVISNDLLDPSYDYDFTNLRDNGTTFIRGMELYKRPYGWKRIALNVRKYGTDRKWLGKVGTNPYEWPVSYHGTRPEFANSIAREGYLLGRGVRFAYGMGIYSTPEINIAERYASQFDRYYARWKVVFQNRVNPVRLSMYHNNVYWVAQRDDDIRPYGLCIKKICDL